MKNILLLTALIISLTLIVNAQNRTTGEINLKS